MNLLGMVQMRLNIQLNALLLHYENERKQARAEQLERHVIPHQESIIKDARKFGLSTTADERILDGMKREYKALTGEDYKA